METIFRARWVSVFGALFGVAGAVIMFAIGGVTTVRAVSIYLGLNELEALSDQAALTATVEIISALDQFLLGLVLFVFAYGVYALFVVPDRDMWQEKRKRVGAPDWLDIESVTDLKVRLLETIAILLAVLFLKTVLESASSGGAVPWSDIVIPISVLLFAASIWLIKRAHGH
ncbi:MAG: YqhA family protein [Acidimicrobiia bacterium]